MLSPKWNIFRAVNYFQLALTLAMLGFWTYRYMSYHHNTMELGYFILFVGSLFVMIINNCLNSHIMHVYFPDKLLPRGKKIFCMILLCFYILMTAELLTITIFGLSEELSRDNRRHTANGWIALGIWAFDIAISIFIIILQVGLPRFLNLHNRQHIQQLVDELGKS
jgi:hypothetical protein